MLTDGKLVVAVGSTNPTKVKAVEAVLGRALADKLLPGVEAVTVTGLEVVSGVAAQPVGEDETMEGALNRAKAALAAVPEATLGVGIEGGIITHLHAVMTTAWCAVVDRKGNFSYGGGLIMPLPPVIIRDLEAGLELGDATDRLYSVQGSKRVGGVLGHLSKGLENRQSAYESIFIYAMVKFLNPELYELAG